MKAENKNRSQWLHVRLRPDEYRQLQQYFKKTTCRVLSEYARKILLQKPITTTVRDQSLDDFMTEAIQLRKELNSLGNNFNQAVKKLHTLQQIQEFRGYILSYEASQNTLVKKVEEINNHIQKIGEKWLQ